MRIDRTIEIDAPRERVYRALTTPSELKEWFRTDVEGELKPGASVWMTYDVHRFQVEIVEMTAPDKVVWLWHPGGVDPAVDYSKENRTMVTFTLEATAAGTRLHLSETGFEEVSLARRAKVFEENTKGWDEVLVWLREYVTQGSK